jgi:hypothetical protein
MDALRISDADRAQALDLLSQQYAEGRLDKDEFDERSDAVWSAKTQGDLAPVFADLPWRSPALSARPARRGPRWGSARGPRRGPRWAPPLLLVILALVAVTVIFELPFLLLALIGLWFVFGGCHGSRRRRGNRSAHLR